MAKIRKGDTVKVLIGKDQGKTGKVIFVDGKASRATVEGLNIYFRHERSRKAGQKGQKIQFPRPMAVSNLMLVCQNCHQPARLGYLVDEQGTKTRMCKNCKRRI